jgi:hypothetical protein
MRFAITTIPHEGRRQRGVIVTCGHCGVSKPLPVNAFQGFTNDNGVAESKFIEKKLTQLGWLVGTKPKQHRCPGCYSAIKAQQKRKSQEKGENVVAVLKQEPVKADAPREMSREERRIIFEKLNEVYVSEAIGYAPGYTDAKVSTELGVPRAWVKGLRDEMFGPEGTNEEIRATVSDAQTLLNDIKVVANTVQEPMKALLAKAEHIEKRLAQIQQDLR